MIKTYKEAGLKVNDTGKRLPYEKAVKLEKNGWRFMSADELFVLHSYGFREHRYFWLRIKGIDNDKIRPVGLCYVNYYIYADVNDVDYISRSRPVFLVKEVRE